MGLQGHGRSSGEIENLAGAIADAVAAQPAVAAAYLFGSRARGAETPLSDIDVGLVLAQEGDADQVVGQVADTLCRRLRTDRLDVVSLGGASIPLRYHVVRDGVLVVCRDAGATQRFVAETIRHYLDLKPLRDGAFHLMRQAILERR